MPSIALCDDDPRDLERIAEAVRACRPEGDDALIVSPFDSPLALLDRVERQGPFDVYLLDIIMPEAPLQGIEAARRIRALDEDACIVFLTVSPEFALDAYAAHPFDYLLKPVDPMRLSDLLEKALAHKKRRSACPTIVAKTASGLVRLSLDDIVFAETAKRAVRYHLRDGSTVLTLTIRTSFKDAMAPLVESGRFAATSSSHVVSLGRVEAMGKTTLRLEDGTTLPLTRLRAEAARRAWLEQWLPREDADGREGAGAEDGDGAA
ncbi:LytR/AlgR family response regulator transcription factor [Arabiibacter massiliensis]|uniref:LytR/AlgR family response regulator transcription factor n=1 Tax=Arabiibacter massiliensis TaxID=1870985 RepID=UPI00155A0CE9|nr:LytTR family DNA-binding domain-containing protein [Arabiibacter massiliensis]